MSPAPTDPVLWMMKKVKAVDPNTKLFLNDFRITDDCESDRLVQQALDLKALNGGDGIVDGLGAQSHFEATDAVCYTPIKNRLDRLSSLGIPVHLTELDYQNVDVGARADGYEVILRTAFAHPGVTGIMFWGFHPDYKGKTDTELINHDWTINAAGQRVIDLLNKWTRASVSAPMPATGQFSFRGFFGDYRVKVTDKTTGQVLVDTTIALSTPKPDPITVVLT